MSESFSSNDSEDEELPSLGFVNSSQYFTKSEEISLDELLSQTIALKEKIKSEKENQKIEDNLVPDNSSQEDVAPCVSPVSPAGNLEPTGLYLFGKLDVLQFFSLDDLGLWKCGYHSIPPQELSKTEKCLLTWSEKELVDVIGYAVKGISPCDIANLNPLVHYILQLVSIYVNTASVNCCAQFIKEMILQHPDVASISFSSAEIFTILFNYGVDIANGESFQMFPSMKTVEAKLDSACKLPVPWMDNLTTVLDCLAAIFQYCKFNKDDLCNILIYLLWMSADMTLKASFVYQELQKCLYYVILGFTDELWPICLTHVLETLMSESSIPVSTKWSFVLDMTRGIPYIICRGVQLRKQVSFIALTHLTGSNPSNSFEYPDESCLISKFEEVSELICYTPKNLQSVAVSFLGIFVMHLKFVSQEDYTTVWKSLKACENSVKDIYDQIWSMHLQHQLMRIYSTLKLSTPEFPEISVLEKETAAKEKGDKRLNFTVQNNTEYAYPIILPPMTSESKITHYLPQSKQSPISLPNPNSEHKSSSARSHSSTPQHQSNRKRPFNQSPSTNSILPFVTKDKGMSSSCYKRRLFNPRAKKAEDVPSSTPASITTSVLNAPTHTNPENLKSSRKSVNSESKITHYLPQSKQSPISLPNPNSKHKSSSARSHSSTPQHQSNRKRPFN